jgi:hypothetical protein
MSATIETNHGSFTIEFERDAAPNTVANFEEIARQGFYDGVVFHRIIPGFVIQGGDPTGTGRGGLGYTFADELPGKDLDYQKYTLAMANAGPTRTGASGSSARPTCAGSSRPGGARTEQFTSTLRAVLAVDCALPRALQGPFPLCRVRS